MILPNLSKDQISTLSKFIVLHCFRTGPIERIHSELEGENRITNEEMKLIMQTAVTEVAAVIDGLSNQRGPYVMGQCWLRREILEDWDEPDWDYIEEINSKD